jgi:large subunit ribosomal protein L19
LNALGVTKYEQIANFSDEEIAQLDEAMNLNGRFEREDWAGQARGLMAESTVGEVPAEEEKAEAEETK